MSDPALRKYLLLVGMSDPARQKGLFFTEGYPPRTGIRACSSCSVKIVENKDPVKHAHLSPSCLRTVWSMIDIVKEPEWLPTTYLC